MKSILDNRPELAHEVNKVAEVAGLFMAKRDGANATEEISPLTSQNTQTDRNPQYACHQ